MVMLRAKKKKIMIRKTMKMSKNLFLRQNYMLSKREKPHRRSSSCQCKTVKSITKVVKLSREQKDVAHLMLQMKLLHYQMWILKKAL
jgi:hypothetical protein